MNTKLPFLVMIGLVASLYGYSQATDSTGATMADLSLEELMNVQVVSASKKSESAFEAPLSIGSVNKDEIRKAGATSIVEALRLIPGILVTEVSNGNYQVDIRGLSNLPPGTTLNNASNSITLVMIDNRPVYNYFTGGTFWETIPVDLNDVERIEVIRGASSALYGPNAAAGVINIITRKIEKQGLYAVGNAQKGNLTNIVNGSVGYKFKKFDIIASSNYQERQRTETDYYQWTTGTKVPADSLNTWFPASKLVNISGTPNASQRYPNPGQSLNRLGYNAFMNYHISDKSNIGLTVGGEQSTAQRAFVDNLATPLTTVQSSTNYADLRGKFNNLNAMVAYQGTGPFNGYQNAAVGQYGYKYTYNTVDAVVEYDINTSKVNFLKNFAFRPGLNYRNATYDDSKYSTAQNATGFLNGKRSLINFAGSFRTEYTLNRFKMIAAIRVDKYNHPSSQAYASYQLTPTYKISDNHFIRANYSRSYRGPNMFDSYNQSYIFGGYQPLSATTTASQYAQNIGNENLKLLSIDLFELGYRGKITENFHVDVDFFHQTVQHYTYLVDQPDVVSFTSTGAQLVIPQTAQNIGLKVIQNGTTISANYVLNKLQIKPSVTIQTTALNSNPMYRNSPAADSVHNINVTSNSTSKGAPSVFGGAYINYEFSKKINLNVSIYDFGKYQYNNIFSNYATSPSASGIVNIPSKFLVNTKFIYKPIEKLDLFVNVRNALNQKSAEFGGTDRTTLLFLVGASFKY